MGDGHNTAARNIQHALAAIAPSTSEVLVADPYTRTNPVVNRLVQKGYAMAINKYPRAWKVVFELLSRPGVVEGMGPLLTELTAAVRFLIKDFKPDLLVSTYPVFPFVVAKIRRRDPATPPLFTVVTDSTKINSSWYRFPCQGFLVADEATARVLHKAKVPEELVHVMGFPVSMEFETLEISKPPENEAWKAIFFPGGRIDRAVATLRRLGEIPHLEVTVVAGKRKAVTEALLSTNLPVRGQRIGWTDSMPALMIQHQFFIGKAGGATVQEAIAARLPFLVNHIVPGQEEGNIALIERSGIGALAIGHPSRVGDVLEGAMAHGGAVWQAWRDNISRIARPGASRAIAKFLLAQHAGRQ